MDEGETMDTGKLEELALAIYRKGNPGMTSVDWENEHPDDKEDYYESAGVALNCFVCPRYNYRLSSE